MRKISLILSPMSAGKYYAKKGLKKNITVYVRETTYNTLLKRAKQNDWSLQTFIRRLLEAAAGEQTEKPPMFY